MNKGTTVEMGRLHDREVEIACNERELSKRFRLKSRELLRSRRPLCAEAAPPLAGKDGSGTVDARASPSARLRANRRSDKAG